jgi:hypothetical protein
LTTPQAAVRKVGVSITPDYPNLKEIIANIEGEKFAEIANSLIIA